MISYYQGEEFESVTKEKVLVDFYADWCGPCKMLGLELEKLKEIKILKVNVDKYQQLARKYNVMSIPCLVLFQNNEEIKRNVGFLPENKIREWIK